MMLWWLLPVVLLCSLAMTGTLRRYALAKNIIDVPNARSSHSIPTPRGGGVSIVLAFLAALAVMTLQAGAQTDALVALGGAGALIAVLGFMDDHGHIAARWRLLGHFAAAVWILYWLGGLPVLQVFGWSV